MKKIYSIITLIVAALVATACTSDIEATQEKGYLKLEVNTLVSTNTRADKPAGYDATAIYVEVVNAQGAVVASTTDFDNDATIKGQNIELEPGTYTVNAHSAGWDGSGSGMDAPYYAGSKSVTVSAGTITTAAVTLTQNNVKVSVIWDETITSNFSAATSTVASAISGVSPLIFTMGQERGAAYFPVSTLTLTLNVTNKDGEAFSQTNTFNDLSARDHLIVTYKLADAGSEGAVNVFIDETTHTYEWTIQIPRKSSIALNAAAANAWSTFANVACTATKSATFDESAVTLQYRKAADNDWTDIDAAQLTTTTAGYSYKLTGLTPATDYAYRFVYDNDGTVIESNEVVFTTETQTQLYNGGFELWHQNSSNNAWYATENGTTYWDSSNPGSASMGAQYNVTTSTTSVVHGGSSAAQLASRYIVIKFAAASLYTGAFDHLVGTKGAVLNWGVPFTSRPTSLHGYFQYAPGSINRGTQPSGVGAPAKGEADVCQIYCALTTEAITVDNTDIAGTFPNWQSDSRVVAYGTLTTAESVSTGGQWKEFDIPFEYHSLTTKPTHLIIVCSSSKYGDYFYGSDSSVLYLDDFELLYGDTPTVQ